MKIETSSVPKDLFKGILETYAPDPLAILAPEGHLLWSNIAFRTHFPGGEFPAHLLKEGIIEFKKEHAKWRMKIEAIHYLGKTGWFVSASSPALEVLPPRTPTLKLTDMISDVVMMEEAKLKAQNISLTLESNFQHKEELCTLTGDQEEVENCFKVLFDLLLFTFHAKAQSKILRIKISPQQVNMVVESERPFALEKATVPETIQSLTRRFNTQEIHFSIESILDQKNKSILEAVVSF